MKIWRCPTCSEGVRAPGHLRKVDARRYCLKCSAKSEDNKLVERVCPSAESERKAREEAAQKAREKKVARTALKEKAHESSERGQLEDFARMAMKLQTYRDGKAWADGLALNWNPYKHVKFEIRLAAERVRKFMQRREEPDGISIGYYEVTQTTPRQKFTSGHAYGTSRFVITAGSDPADARTIILHEIAHLSAGYVGGAHGDGWRSVYALAVRELTGDTPSGRTTRDLDRSARECVRLWMERFNP